MNRRYIRFFKEFLLLLTDLVWVDLRFFRELHIQSGVNNTNNLMPDKMIQQLEKHIENLQAQILHLREQNKKLLKMVSNEKDR